jgi:Spy/CpxP family protein refolding chaperone
VKSAICIRRRSTGLAMFGALALVVATPTPIDSARWWRSPRIATRLELTAVQVRALDGIHSRMMVESARCAAQARAARDHAERLLAAGASESDLDTAAVGVADAQSARRRTRTLGLYEMYSVLTSEQRNILSKLALPSRQQPSTPPH